MVDRREHHIGVLESIHEHAEPVNNREHRRDHRAVGAANAAAHRRQRRLGGMGECFDPRQVEKAATPFDRMNEPKNFVELDRVFGTQFPRD